MKRDCVRDIGFRRTLLHPLLSVLLFFSSESVGYFSIGEFAVVVFGDKDNLSATVLFFFVKCGEILDTQMQLLVSYKNGVDGFPNLSRWGNNFYYPFEGVVFEKVFFFVFFWLGFERGEKCGN